MNKLTRKASHEDDKQLRSSLCVGKMSMASLIHQQTANLEGNIGSGAHARQPDVVPPVWAPQGHSGHAYVPDGELGLSHQSDIQVAVF